MLKKALFERWVFGTLGDQFGS